MARRWWLLVLILLVWQGAVPFAVLTNTLNVLAEQGDVPGALKELRSLLGRKSSRLLQQRVFYNTAIKACANAGNLEEAERLLEEMMSRNVLANRKTFGKMMEAAAKTGNLTAAEHWFRQMQSYGHETSERDIDQLIHAAALAQDLAAAERWFQDLLRQGLQPTPVTLNGLLEACARVGEVSKAQAFMAKWKALGLPTTDWQLFLLRKVYAKSNDLATAEENLRQTAQPGIKDYTMVMDAAARCGNLTAAEFWFHEAEAQKLPCPALTFFTVMSAAARAADLKACEAWLVKAQSRRLEPDAGAYTALVTAAAESLDLEAAERWLQRCRHSCGTVPEATNAALRAAGLRGDLEKAEAWAEEARQDGMLLDGYSYRALLTACGRSHDTKSALRWFRHAVEHGDVELSTCNAAIQAAARAGDVSLAEDLLAEMKGLKVDPDRLSYQGLLSAASTAADLPAAERLLRAARRDGFQLGLAPVIACAAKARKWQAVERWFSEAERVQSLDVFVFNALIAHHGRIGDLEKAECWFRRMRELGEEPSLLTYTSLISAAAKQGRLQVAQGYLSQAIEEGLKPDMVIMNSLIAAAGKVGDLSSAMEAYQQALAAGLQPTTMTYGALIACALRCGNLSLAESWLEECRSRGLRPGAALLTPFITHAAQRDMPAAEAKFAAMLAEGIRPDVVTMGSLISVANKAGEADVADRWLRRAFEEGIRPNKVCYGLVINALARNGSIDRSLQRLDDMVQDGFPAEAREVNSLLKACASAKHLDCARAVLERITAWRVQPDMLTKRYLQQAMGNAWMPGDELHFGSLSSARRREPMLRPAGGHHVGGGPARLGQERIHLRS